MRFGPHLTVGAAIGALWALLIAILVDSYGFAAALAAMAASQVLAALCITPAGLHRPLHPVPHRSQRSSARCAVDVIDYGTIADGHDGA